MSKKEKEIPVLIECLLRFEKKLPVLNEKGDFYWRKTSGPLLGTHAKTWRLNSSKKASEADVKKKLDELMKNPPFIEIESPRKRADTILRAAGSAGVDESIVKKVASQFLVPEGQRCIFIGPEYFYRDDLRKDEKFQIRKKNLFSKTEKVVGVGVCCPYCLSHEFVYFQCFDCYQHRDRMPRAATAMDASKIPFFGARYTCTNTNCVGKVPKGEVHASTGDIVLNPDRKDGEKERVWCRAAQQGTSHSFTPWTPEFYEILPELVRKKYGRLIYELGAEEALRPRNVPTPEFALQILDPSNTFAKLERTLNDIFLLKIEMARAVYYEFLEKVDVVLPDDLIWPDFDRERFKEEFGPLKEDGIEKIFWLLFKQIEPYLDRDQWSRAAGAILRWDGTYGSAQKLIGLPEMDSPEVLLIIFGTYGDILIHGFFSAENPKNLQILHFVLMKRHKRFGHKILHDVIEGYDDLGSGNLKDPTKHWFPKIWPMVKRAPRKDVMHAVKRVTGTFDSNGNPMHAGVCNALSQSLIRFTDFSIAAAVRQYKSENRGVTDEVARLEVLKSSKWRAKMYNYAPKITVQLQLARKAWEKARKDNEFYMSRDGGSYRNYFRQSTPQANGSEREFELFLSHIERGDFQDPFPPQQMSFVRRTAVASNVTQAKKRKASNLENLGRLRGTSGSESSNKVVNKSTQDATRMRLVLGAAKSKLRIHEHNLKKDREFGRLTKRMAKSIVWMLQEANDVHSGTIDSLEVGENSLEYPREPLAKEPTGMDFLSYETSWASDTDMDYLNAMERGETPRLYAYHDTPDEAKANEKVEEFDDIDDGFAAALASMDEGDGDAFAESRISPKKRKLDMSATDGSKWNRKKGNISGLSPTRVAIRPPNEVPLNLSQQEAVSTILASIVSDGSTTENVSSSSVATALQTQWNQTYYQQLQQSGQSPIGGILTSHAARQIVDGIQQTQVNARVPNVSTIIPPSDVVSMRPPPSSKPAVAKRGRKAAPIQSLEQLTDTVIVGLSQRQTRRHIEHYREKFGLAGGSIPGRKPAISDMLIGIVEQCNRVESNQA